MRVHTPPLLAPGVTVVPCCPPAGASDELSRQDEPAAAGALRLTPIVLAAAGCCCCCCCLSVLRAACRRDWLDSPRRRCVHGSAGCPILRQVVLGGLNRTEGTALCEQMQVRNRPTHTHTHACPHHTNTSAAARSRPAAYGRPRLRSVHLWLRGYDPGQPPTAARDAVWQAHARSRARQARPSTSPAAAQPALDKSPDGDKLSAGYAQVTPADCLWISALAARPAAAQT